MARRMKHSCKLVPRFLLPRWDRKQGAKNVISFCREQGITHFLINARRYAKSIVSRSSTFEPLTSYAAGILKGVKPEDLIFSAPPESVVVFRHGSLLLIDVEKLEQVWVRERG